MNPDLKGRVALVTGASRGIGFAVACGLARAGAHVVALARTQGGLEELDDSIRAGGGEATLVPCDLRDFDALDRLGAALFERWGKLDIFVGNAGVLGPISPLAHVDQKQWDEVMAVNVTANWRLIRSLDPLLRASDAGRVAAVVGRRQPRRPAPLLGALRRVEGGTRRAFHASGRDPVLLRAQVDDDGSHGCRAAGALARFHQRRARCAGRSLFAGTRG